MREKLWIKFGPSNIAFMEDLIAHQDEEIKVRFLGDEYNTDIVMTDSMKDALVTFYQLYVKAGGTLFEDMGIVTETIMEVE